jgi:hypothetical protein
MYQMTDESPETRSETMTIAEITLWIFHEQLDSLSCLEYTAF